MNLGEIIKDLRLRKHVSQKILAQKVGITQGYLSLIEQGEREPSLDLIKQIAVSLDIPQQLFFLLMCEVPPRHKSYAKSIKKIAVVIDDILKSI